MNEEARSALRGSRTEDDLPAAVIHILGAALSVAALVLLVARAALAGEAWLIVAFSLYGASLIYHYVISALAHLLEGAGARRVFADLDEAGAYFLLAGSWTPLAFGPLRGGLGWTSFGLLWGLALFCFLGTISLFGAVKQRMFAGYYLGAGLVLPLLKPIRERIPEAVFAWVAMAGLCYVLGLLFRSREQPYQHAIWHAFVLCASICHFFGLLGLV